MNKLLLSLSLFLGCTNAGLMGYNNSQEFAKAFDGYGPDAMCSKGGAFRTTLRSYQGKFCDGPEVCNLAKNNCFPGGQDSYNFKESHCYKNCVKNIGLDFFKGVVTPTAIEKDYETMGLEPGATCGDIRKSYKKLAIKLHPDKGGTKEQFQEMQNAYEDLNKSLSCS